VVSGFTVNWLVNKALVIGPQSQGHKKRVTLFFTMTFVRPTQPVEIFRNFSSPFGTLAIL